MSELYERKPDDVPRPIGYLLDRVLLPNSRADAIALVKQRLHDELINQLTHHLEAANLTVGTRVRLVALELDLLRERAQKDPEKLRILVKQHLTSIAGSTDVGPVAENILNLLIDFENQSSGPLGRRPFFTEEERIAIAEQLGDRVLVERMTIPPDQQSFRPRFPIAGIKESGYAFSI